MEDTKRTGNGKTGFLAFAIVGCVFAAGCGPATGKVKDIDAGWDPGGDGASVDICRNNHGRVVCEGNEMVTCGTDGEEIARQNCGTMQCMDGTGCVLCLPGESYCEGNNVMVCGSDMMGWVPGAVCDPDEGEVCDPELGACLNLCDRAAENQANVGCEYLAVKMSNSEGTNANDGCFVVIISNVQEEGTAVVTVEDDEGNMLDFPGFGTARHVAPGELAILALSGSPGFCSYDPAVPNAIEMQTGVFPGTVFRVRTTLPVVAYQINPFEAATLHTTDASLLIPEPALGLQYYTANYHGLSGANHYPSSISIVPLEDDTHITISPSAPVLAGGPVTAGEEPFDVTLNAMEHLQILAQSTGDLTASLITSNKPIAVFSGVLCANIPQGKGFCDHIEQQMPPIQSWGWTYVAAFPPRRASENTLWRVIAAVDNTRINFDPLDQYNTVLSGGEMLEIDTDQSFLVYATSNAPDPEEDPPILVVNYLKGAEQTASESGVSIWDLGTLRGDPAMILSVPVEQYLNSYVFLADPSYAYNYVVVVRTEPGQLIHLDCLDPIPEDMFEQITGEFARAAVTLKAQDDSAHGSCQQVVDGVHNIWSEQPFGIWVYGYYSDTSYGYPGGMNLEQINEVVIVH